MTLVPVRNELVVSSRGRSAALHLRFVSQFFAPTVALVVATLVNVTFVYWSATRNRLVWWTVRTLRISVPVVVDLLCTFSRRVHTECELMLAHFV